MAAGKYSYLQGNKMRIRGVLALLAVLVFGPVHATEHVRGEYRFRTGPVPEFVNRTPVAAQWPENAPGADDTSWRYWLIDRQVDYRGGREREFIDYVYEPRSASLLRDAGRYEIEFLPGTQELTLHEIEVLRAGTWSTRLDPARISLARREEGFNGDIADGVVTALVLLDDLRLGDVVRIVYTIDGANPMLAGQGTVWMRGGYSNPVLDARTRVLFDPGTAVSTKPWQTTRDATVRTLADATEVSFVSSQVAATIDHGDYPRGHTPRPAVHVGRRQAWADVVAWAVPFYPPVPTPLPDDLEERIVRWKRLPAPADRLRAALRAVQDEVRYFGIEIGENTHRPHDPSTVWTRRFGDCKDKTYLLVTLLERLGIEAVPALVSVDDGPRIREQVPSGSAFDHVIVRATLDGKPVWVDPTIAQQGGDPAAYDLSDLGVALPVVAGAEALEPILAPADDVSGTEVKERFEVAADGKAAELSIVTVYRGWAADDARQRLGRERREDTARRYEDFYRKRFGELAANGLPEVLDDRDTGVLTVTERYRLAAGINRESGVGMLHLYADALRDPTAVPRSERHPGPLRMPQLGRFVHETEVVAPDDWSPRFGTERDARKSPGFEYVRTLDVDGSVARLRYEFNARKRNLTGADVAPHLSELKSVSDLLSSTLRYQMPTAINKSERDARLKALLRETMKEQGQ